MEKRTIVITGGNSGLGYQCARNIAETSNNYTVVIACRNIEKAAATKRLQLETGNPHIYALKLDLASLESIRSFYEEFCHKKYPPLYSLVCNAGINNRGVEYTKDGFEMNFGVNHLGHYLLANMLLNQMVSSGRMVFVSSDTHKPSPPLPYSAPVFKNARILAYPEKNGEDERTVAMLRYPTSKLCNILCVHEMADRLAAETEKHITVNAFNPGLMTGTNFMAKPSNAVLRIAMEGLMSLLGRLIGRLGNSKKSGKALASMITEAQYEHITGKYYDRGKETESSKPSYNKTAARNLWIESAELVKLKQGETILSIT